MPQKEASHGRRRWILTKEWVLFSVVNWINLCLKIIHYTICSLIPDISYSSWSCLWVSWHILFSHYSYWQCNNRTKINTEAAQETTWSQLSPVHGNQALVKASIMLYERIWLWHERQAINELDWIVIYFVLSPGLLLFTSEHVVCRMHSKQICSVSLPRINDLLTVIMIYLSHHLLDIIKRLRSSFPPYCLGLMKFQITWMTTLMLLLNWSIICICCQSAD